MKPSLRFFLMLSVIMIALILISANVNAEPTNGGFETGDFTGYILVAQNSPQESYKSISTARVHSGTYSAKLQYLASPSGFYNVVVAKKYHWTANDSFEIWIYNEAGAGVRWRMAYNNGSSYGAQYDISYATDQWVHYTHTFTQAEIDAMSDHTQAQLSFYTTGTTGALRTAYYDDIVINNALTVQTPVANFTTNQTSGYYPLCVQFNDTSTNVPASWAWDFDNDGDTDSTVQNATYTYNNVGDYTVKLTATNTAGSDAETKVDLISVFQPAPVFGEGTGGAGTTTTTTGDAPFPVTFQSNATGDDLTLSWDFGDGTTSTEAAPTHTYDTPGTYTVTVTITNLGGSITDTFTITVPGFVHSANITGAIGSTAGLHARFNDTSTMDVVNDTTTDLTSFSMGRLIYDATKPLSLYGVGDWWIIILLGVIAAIIILGQNNSPFLTILLLMIGNLALWGLASKHFDMLGTVTTLALFSLAMIGISVYKGSKSRG